MFEANNSRKAVAAQLWRIADEISAAGSNELTDVMEELSANWTGDAADAFLRRIGEFQQILLTETRALKILSEDIQRNAEN